MEAIKDKIKQAGGNKSKIIELNLSGIKISHFSPEMTALLEQCINMQLLILSECDLESLFGLPKVPLEGIDLSNNKITDQELIHLKPYTHLSQLLLSDNRIDLVDSLQALEGCNELSELDASGNPAADDPTYRKFLFDMLAGLSCLDGKDMEGNQIEEEEDFDDGAEDQDQEDQFSGEDQEAGIQQDDDDDSEPPKNKKKGKKSV